MNVKSGKNQVGLLNRSMYKLISSFPKAHGELVDFHFKSEFENYLSAIQSVSGQTLFVSASNADEIMSAIRRLILVSDLIVFNVHSYIGTGKICFFPIPDTTRSPVLGMMPVLALVYGLF